MLRSIFLSMGVSIIIVIFGSSTMAYPFTAGYALSFSDSEYVTILNSVSLNPSQLTIECWVKFNSFFKTVDQNRLIDKMPYTLLEYQFGSPRIYFEIRPVDYNVVTPNIYVECDTLNLTSNIWYHIAGTYDSDWLKLFLNGNLIAKKQVGKIILGDNNSLRLGSLYGELDEVRIWSIARTQDEIRSIMNLEIDSFSELISVWHFNEGSGQEIHDSDDGNNGFLGSSSDTDLNDPQWVQSTAPLTVLS